MLFFVTATLDLYVKKLFLGENLQFFSSISNIHIFTVREEKFTIFSKTNIEATLNLHLVRHLMHITSMLQIKRAGKIDG